MEEQGDGLYNIICNSLIRRNYFHDCLCDTGAFEGDSSDEQSLDRSLKKDDYDIQAYYHYLDNVSVNTMGMALNSSVDLLKFLDSVRICGNQFWNTGRHDNGKICFSLGALMLWPNHYGECIISDNIIFGSEKGYRIDALLCLHIYTPETWGPGYAKPTFRDNTYAQYTGRNLADFLYQDEETWSIDDPLIRAKAAEYLGDTTSSFYIIPTE